MTDSITIRKGLDIPLGGEAELRLTDARSIGLYAVKPTDFVGLVPRLLVEEDQPVNVGEALLCDKNDERIRFTSPVAGRVKAIVRGEKRKLTEVVVEAEGNTTPATRVDEPPHTAEELKALMLRWGLWPMLRQRPFGTIPCPDDKPKAIFVSAFSSAPLAPDYDFVMQGREDFFKKGVEVLAQLTDGKVHVCFRPEQQLAKHLLPPTSYLLPHYVKGPHPAGNVGTQIAHIDPINRGEKVWTMNLQDVAVLGELVATGVYNPVKVIAIAGPQVSNPHYYRIKAGACLESLVAPQLPHPSFPKITEDDTARGNRIISGNVLSGTQIDAKGYLGAYDDLVSILPEGDYFDFMGWLMPGFRKFSYSRTFLSGILTSLGSFSLLNPPAPLEGGRTKRQLSTVNCQLSTILRFDTNTHGDQRPLVFTGDFERVFPFDIYPTQLIKACVVGDIELMENLGIYEVEPEDFALCEFIDTSKTEIQTIVREALEKIRKEG